MASYPCPDVNCDVFPFDNLEDLQAHIASGDHTNPESRGLPTISARFEGRNPNFTPGPKPARYGGAPTSPSSDAPSEKQLAFLAKLRDERDIEFDLASIKNKREASLMIDNLLKLPKTQKAPKAPATPTVEVPEGLHLHEGDVFKVQRSGAGHLYAKLRNGRGWDYVGKAPLRFLSADTLLTLESAKQYGLETGVCCNCGATLTDPNSIAAGIGPICASRF